MSPETILFAAAVPLVAVLLAVVVVRGRRSRRSRRDRSLGTGRARE